jgi:ComF family protein
VRWHEPLLDLLYPPACCACGRRTARPEFCLTCAARISTPASPQCPRCGVPFRTRTTPSAPPTSGDHPCGRCLRRPPRFRRARACTLYDSGIDHPSPVTLTLHRYKYQRDASLARPLGEFLAARAPLDLTIYDVVIPVPLHVGRLRWRGFNQSLLLARQIGRKFGPPVDPFALERVRPTRPQVELSGSDRRHNVLRAFQVSDRARVQHRDVLLVDDVYTTGATVEECTRTLLQAGARNVDVLVLARAL